jgi:hypothetical protein
MFSEEPVAEVPKHLLEKAAARRAALSGAPAPVQAAEADAPSGVTSTDVVAAGSTSAVAAASTAPAVGGGGGGSKSLPPVPSGPPPLPKGSRFATVGSVFMLVAIPIWALFMFNAWATPISRTLTPEKIGENTFAQCTSCHNANGSGWDGGGVGRPLWNGNAEQTFLDPLDQMAFVYGGSCPKGEPYGDPKRAGGQHKGQQKGAMGNWVSLTPTEIAYVVTYERALLKKDGIWPEDIFAKVGEKADAKRALEPIDEAKLLKQIEERRKTLCGK